MQNGIEPVLGGLDQFVQGLEQRITRIEEGLGQTSFTGKIKPAWSRTTPHNDVTRR